MELVIIFVLIVSATLISFVLISLSSPTAIGKRGEQKVNSIIQKYLDKEKYIAIDNVTIPRGTNRTTQIDHVILSVYGIFVIETKNYTGWIFGSPHQRQWTRIHYREKNYFQNPIKQNWGHIYALSNLLDVPKWKFRNIVCFTGSSEFKTDVPDEVYFGSDFVSGIRNYDEPVFTKKEVNTIYSKLQKERLEQGPETEQIHIHNIHAQPQDGDLTCAQCGAPMVLRTARNGPSAGSKFWGCSTYPKCRHTVSIK